MAIRYAVATGNWSNTATWDGGTLPTSADDVYADGKTVTIDQNVTIISLNNGLRSGGTIGGSFKVDNTGFNITATSLIVGTTTILLTINTTGTLTINATIPTYTPIATAITINGIGSNIIYNGNISTGGSSGFCYGINVNTSNALLTITGNLTNPTTTNVYSSAVQVTSNSRVIITGNVTGPSVAGSNGTFYNNSTNTTGSIINGLCISGNSPAFSGTAGTVTTINGTQTAVGTAGIYAIFCASASIVNINGDCLGALSTAPSTALIVNNVGTGTVNINGSVTARSVSPSTTVGIVNNASTGTINVSTNVSGGSVANTIGISNTTTGTINVTGNITGGSHATNTPAIYSTTAGTIDITGSCSADAYPALFSTSTTATNRLRGDVLTKNGIVAYYAWKVNISTSAAQSFTFQDTSNANRLIATSNISPGAPAIANVRYGTVYGSSGEFTGTLRVPNPNTVSLGVLTDNTTGTMLMTPADFWNAQTSGLTTSGSIGERLKNASTVQTNGDQLASYIV